MKKHAMWLIPGLLASATVWAIPACSSSNDSDPGTGDDSGIPGPDGSRDPKDSGSNDARPNDAANNSDANNGDSGEAGAVDPYMAACARIDACAAANAPRIGMNGCYSLITSIPFARDLDSKDRIELENLKCKLAATTCAGVRACERPLADYTSFCQEQEEFVVDHCDGNVHVLCDFDTLAPIRTVDCAATGGVCGTQGPLAACGKATCEQGVTPSTCAGDTLSTCTSGNVMQDIDCKTANTRIFIKPIGAVTIAGTTCGLIDPDGGTDVECVGSGASCSGALQRCDGTVLETCSYGRLTRRDCATVTPAGQGCTQLADGPMAGSYGCGPVNPACHPEDNETCNTSTGVIGFCGLTETKTVDCKALGYAGCKTTTVGERVAASCFQ